MAQPAPLVVFDFDHTLTDRETLSRFLLGHLPAWRVARGLFLLPFFLPMAWLRFGWRDGTKRGVLKAFLQGMPAVDFFAAAQDYAVRVLPHCLKLDMERLIRSYIQEGREVWMISGSLLAYLHPLAQSLGIRVVLACEMSVDKAGRLTGQLRGGNCWGPEKLRRLRLMEPLADRPLVMYGDSKGDRDLLEVAWEAHLLH